MERAVYEVISTGVNERSDAVVRIMLPKGGEVEVSTNVIGMAKLAAAGVRVVNDYRGNGKK